jgi:hypothetical protein
MHAARVHANGMHACTRRACVRALGVCGTVCLHTACARALGVCRCVHTTCVRAHDVRGCVQTACVRAYGVHGAYVHMACERACTRRACVRIHGVRACTWRAYVHTACMVRTYTLRAYVHTACVRAHGVCVCVGLSVLLSLSHSLSDSLHTAGVRACTLRRRRGPQVCFSANTATACEDAAAALVRSATLFIFPSRISSAEVYTGALVGPRVNPEFRVSAAVNVSAHDVRACSWREFVHTACLRAHGMRACVCLPHGLSQCLTQSVRLCPMVCLTHCTQRACVHTACMRSHSVRACTRRAYVRACTWSVTPCVRSHRDSVRGCTRRAYVRAHFVRACTWSVTPCVRSRSMRACVHTACVRACPQRAFTRRACVRAHGVRRTRRACTRRTYTRHACVYFACAHTAVCFCAHGGCIHPAPAPWCTGRCFSATTKWRARVHTACVCAHSVQSSIHPAPSPLHAGCCYSATIVAARTDAALVGAAPLGFTQGP